MTSQVWYDSIGMRIVSSQPVKNLSGRDKCQLMNHLMEDLGLMAAIQAEPDSCERFQQLWKECIDKHWGGK